MTRFFAPAKINLGLSVLGVRENGYHDLHSLMVPLTVGDELEIRPAEALTLRVEGADLPTDERNLVYRAARAYLDAAGGTGGADIVLHKRLPLASGLGGGSSDAASTLLALAELYPSDVDLPALALSLGADVPFFLLGGAALAQGVGERLTPIHDLPPVHLVLANAGAEISAGDAYRWLDETGDFSSPLRLDAIRQALASGVEVPYFNSLQAGVLAHFPSVLTTLEALADAGLHSVLMSGSGATCFGLARDEAQAQAAAGALAAQFPQWWVKVARVEA
ncbi:4-(cytidine 5'-diphospho)-2-C-methyl-D-erythritol kinase [Deinococcus wulumuqiensis]|uniref:4-(cytidine 5'-diphospho)-2-C-methyl-D-erythritol kinase n=1 Tax=Deinococcus wulumuqiensis TaxID=980427 RepID=UPI00178C4ED9|nr:4-(cytidine 5'-diphospho)-2-C-methyl-D-erythritol kinase [Deinococcus wulumuqiensis]